MNALLLTFINFMNKIYEMLNNGSVVPHDEANFD